MSHTVSSSIVKEKVEYFWPVLGLILCLTGAMEAFPLSFISKSNVWIGLCLLPLVMRVRDRPRLNYAYLVCMVLLGIAGGYYGARTFYFLTLMFYLLLITERYYGRLDSIVWFLLLFMSPFFHQIAVIIGFPVRLILSAWAGSLMTWAGADVEVQGNLMTVQGASFAVDDACMGLNMVSISMLAGVFAVAYQGRRDQKKLSLPALLGFFLIVFCFNLVSNLLRIITLVTFRIGPDNFLHETLGLVCMAVYVFVPVFFLSRWWLGRWGRPWSPVTPDVTPPATLFSMGLVALAGVLLIMGVSIGRRKTSYVAQPPAKIELSGFTPTALKDGVTKFENAAALVYVKPIPEFFSSEHTPLFCWKGSGYTFKSIAEDTVNQAPIYRGVLVRGGSKLYTAWWYTNGSTHTISQAQWRWRMLQGERRFCLINVTAANADTLSREVARVMEQEQALE
jgi:exosortase N